MKAFPAPYKCDLQVSRFEDALASREGIFAGDKMKLAAADLAKL
jgi:hypothetical protein